ncbi:leucine-rich repeat transmembrane protein FLRT2-like [Eupeodes corollae]|uniref:leucine-rich repeat transmembrane protein FLRT2-like n=1 Tax=Eupeodes corollae TaxID=290404 RepID=UPI00249083D9|nr:leucine-rich repeat transmembrane protein FLRT2-like [Eupeodes corollae]
MQLGEMHLITIIQLAILMLSQRGYSIKLLAENSKDLYEIHPNISHFQSTIKITKPEGQCQRFQCKFICSNGESSTIQRNINAVDVKECTLISELYLINYHFPRKTLTKKFLGSICDRVSYLSIQSSDIEQIDPGAFESQTLIAVHLENLKLKHIEKGIFENVSQQFTSFTLIQTNPKLETVSDILLENVKYQIKNLTLQTGLIKVKNLTGSNALLNNLEDIDLSYNNFGGELTTGCFNQLSVVQKLNLSHSAITSLPESIFNGIVVTLKILDLSNNRLLVIERNIFGWRNLTKALTLHLNGNPWECTCDLQREMTVLLAFQDQKVHCGNIKNALVSSEKVCPTTIAPTAPNHLSGGSWNNAVGTPSAKTTTSTPTRVLTTKSLPPPTASNFNTYATTHELECHKDNEKQETEHLSIHWPNTMFDIVRKKMSEVDIVIRKHVNETYGVLWFNKVTLQFYKMETNHNEYGLGCYGRVEHITTINHLLPDLSYTFCLILKDHLTVSPFSCQSVHIDGNLDVKYNAWLTKNMKATGIGIMIIGSILFIFLGIFSAFILLKHKPSLIKGSKRVAMQKSDTSNIIIFPEDKTLQHFKLMEEQLAKNRLRGFPFQRLSSVSDNSLESIQSYMNTENVNIYEIIPAHQPSSKVRYAEVPFKRKRSSNDPLPEIPHTSKEDNSVKLARTLEVPRNQNNQTETSLYI